MSFNGDKFLADIVDTLTKNQMTTLHLNWRDSRHVQFRDSSEFATQGWQAAASQSWFNMGVGRAVQRGTSLSDSNFMVAYHAREIRTQEKSNYISTAELPFWGYWAELGIFDDHRSPLLPHLVECLTSGSNFVVKFKRSWFLCFSIEKLILRHSLDVLKILWMWTWLTVNSLERSCWFTDINSIVGSRIFKRCSVSYLYS